MFGLRRIVEQERQIRDKTEAEDRASFLADHDHLTGLPNRRRFQRELETAIRQPPASPRTHALFMLDLNGFKTINDRFGHAQGDEVLRTVSSRLSSILKDRDLLARLGGDEFAMIVRDLPDAASASHIAERIERVLERPIESAGSTHVVGTGIGIVLIPADRIDADTLVRQADMALYHAKSSDRPGFAMFDDRMDQETRRKAALQVDLREAIQRGDIVPFYQPIVDLDTGEVLAFEALARWTHASLGAVPPATFIPLAEEFGMIRDLSDQLLAMACEAAVAWPSTIDLTFNVSPIMLRDATFGLRILAIVASAGLDPRRLELEIVESAVCRDLERARENLNALQDAGIRIVLDDFGTGATALEHLRTFRFDGIKIDQRFVDLMIAENETTEIVKAMLALAQGLGLSVVAEGIEGAAQSAALRGHGCRRGQGFLFGRAMPVGETLAFLASEPAAAQA